VLAKLESADDLPWGWGADIGTGHYRLRRRDDNEIGDDNLIRSATIAPRPRRTRPPSSTNWPNWSHRI
jgi:hypothetical protein